MAAFQKQSAPSATKERVEVNLKMLLKLSGAAENLTLHYSEIKSQQSGGYLSRSKGRGMEFDEVRPYQPGDDIRSIDWRVTARSGKTHTKLYREERERPVFISVDYRAAMQFATRGVFKSVQAAKLAALIAWLAQKNGDRVGGQVFSDTTCLELKPQNGKHGVLRFFNALVNFNVVQQQNFSFEHIVSRLTQHARPGSLVYMISDFRGFNHKSRNYFTKLARHCDVVLILISDPLETQLPEKGRYRFTDEEKDLLVDTGDQQLVSQYKHKFIQRQHDLKDLSKQLNLKFIQCSTTADAVQVLR
jgi:uncharacterized protein (DUF58 family)